MKIKEKFEKEFTQMEEQNNEISSLIYKIENKKAEAKKFREDLITEIIYEITASVTFEEKENAFLQMKTDEEISLLSALISRADYVSPIAGEVTIKEAWVSVPKARLRVVIGEDEDIKVFLRNINKKFKQFNMKIILNGIGTVQRHYLKVIFS